MRQIHLGPHIHALDNLIRRKAQNINSLQYVESITGTNFWIIGYLADNRDQEICQKDLEKKFSITRSTASKVIKLMEQKGLVERLVVPHDARLKKLVLTEKALGLHQEIVNEVEIIENNLIKGFSKEEIELFLSFVDRMKNNLKETH
jgi:DNA-binding MarR family transcriptional regulator